MSAQVVATQLREDGAVLYLVESDETLEPGTKLQVTEQREPAKLIAHFLTEGDELEGGLEVSAAYAWSVWSREKHDYVPVMNVETTAGTPFTYDAYDEVPVRSRRCQSCKQRYTTSRSTWRDRAECPSCEGPDTEAMEGGPF